MQEMAYKMLNGEMDLTGMFPSGTHRVLQTREERIQAHMKAVRESNTHAAAMTSTRDLVRKQPSVSLPDVSSLSQISIAKLEPKRIPYQGRILFCKIITPPMLMASAMTLVEDANGDLADLAVYNLTKAGKKLFIGRKIAIIEPFYKMRADGTPGIRVDNPSEIKYDIEAPSTTMRETTSIAVEQEVKKEAGMSTAIENTDFTPIIPDRYPGMHRIVIDLDALCHRDEGNAAFKMQRFDEAERLYTLALKAAKMTAVKPGDESKEGVALWTLYSNHSMARLKLGKPDLALKDAVMSHKCAPIEAAKPFLRCVQALISLGWHAEALTALEGANNTYTDGEAMLAEVQQKLGSIKRLRVGPEQQ